MFARTMLKSKIHRATVTQADVDAYLGKVSRLDVSGHDTGTLVIGVRESARFNAAMVAIKGTVILFFIFSATGEAYGTCWALWGSDAFHWNGLSIGLSLGAFGICQTFAQALLPGPAVKLLGERAAILVGVAGVSLALAVTGATFDISGGRAGH